jgi:outer membrane protein X
MKNFLVGLFMLVALSATAQQYKRFKSTCRGSSLCSQRQQQFYGWFLVAVEPKYGFSDHFDLGLRLEAHY